MTTQIKPPSRWLRVDGSTVSCTESVKVLNENWSELVLLVQNSLEDAVLLGCGKQLFKAELHRLIDELVCDYQEQNVPIELKK